jgi:hypothetical protein
MLDFTTASPEHLSIVYREIAREIGDDRFFTSKELDVLPRILSPYEQVLSFSSGLMDGNTWLIVLTDTRVLFVDKGMFFGLKQSSIDLENIIAIDGETGLMFGSISISMAAGPREIKNVWKRTVNPFIKKVRQAIDFRRRREKLLSPNIGSVDPVEIIAVTDKNAEMKRLDRLKAAGSITDHEYQEMKKRL